MVDKIRFTKNRGGKTIIANWGVIEVIISWNRKDLFFKVIVGGECVLCASRVLGRKGLKLG